MNRDARPSNTPPQPANTPANYLVYLFIFSVVFIVLLPYIVPWMGMIQRPMKKTGNDMKPKSQETFKDSSLSSTPQSYVNSPFQRSYLTDGKYDVLESLIMDIQKAVQMERERTMKLENDVRILELSERFLKERIQMVEDRNIVVESPKASYNSLQLISQSIDGNSNNLGNIDVLVRELLRAVQKEKERTDSLDMEIGKLKMSESSLKDRMELLELKISSLMKISESLPVRRFVTN